MILPDSTETTEDTNVLDEVFITEFNPEEKERTILEKASTKIPEDAFSYVGDQSQFIEPPFDFNAVTHLTLKNPWHFACIQAITRAAVQLGYKFVLAAGCKDSPKEYKKLTEVLEAIESKDSLAEKLEAVIIDYCATGNGYLEITRNRKGEVDGVYAIPATTVRVNGANNLYCQQRNGKIVYFYPFGMAPEKRGKVPATVEEQPVVNEIIHLRNYSPMSDYYGIPNVISALRAIVGDIKATDFNLQFFENNAIPQYAVVITGGKVTESVTKHITEYFRKHIKGNNHATLVIPLPTNMNATFVPLSTAPKEASFLLYRKMNREEICAIHGVPPAEAGIWEQAVKANSEVQSVNFKLKVVRPLQKKLEHKLNRIIKLGLGIKHYEFEFELLDYGDEKVLCEIERLKADIRRIDINSGYKTINEFRRTDGKDEGLQDVEWGDKPPDKLFATYDTNDFNNDPNNRDDKNMTNSLEGNNTETGSAVTDYDSDIHGKLSAVGE